MWSLTLLSARCGDLSASHPPADYSFHRVTLKRCISHISSSLKLLTLTPNICIVDGRHHDYPMVCHGKESRISGTAQGCSSPYTPRPQRKRTLPSLDYLVVRQEDSRAMAKGRRSDPHFRESLCPHSYIFAHVLECYIPVCSMTQSLRS